MDDKNVGVMKKNMLDLYENQQLLKKYNNYKLVTP